MTSKEILTLGITLFFLNYNFEQKKSNSFQKKIIFFKWLFKANLIYSKSIEVEPQNLIELLIFSASWVKPQVKVENIHVKIEHQYDECKIEYIDIVLKEKFNKYVYYRWIQQSIIVTRVIS